MIEKLPYYYRKSRVVEELYTAVQKIIDKISADISAEDLMLFITTTTDFTLHEKDVGLPAITADNETKRARVIARIQGNSVLTKSALYDLIDIYDKTGCTITEDFANYTVTIAFTGRKGKPYNFNEIQSAVDEVKPAHIKIEYAFEKNTWNDLRLKLNTWGNAMSLTWGDAEDYDGRTWLYVEGKNVYLREDGANAYVVFKNGIPYARLL